MIDLISDLHVEYWNEYDWVINKKNDIVLILGDISTDLRRVIDELNKACDVYSMVLFIDGNHESFIYNQIDLNYAISYIEKMMAARLNFISLYTNHFEINDYVFIGINGWWDFEVSYSNLSKDKCIHNFIEMNPKCMNVDTVSYTHLTLPTIYSV